MNDRLRVGLVGADAAGKGWGATAHMPALRLLDALHRSSDEGRTVALDTRP